MLMMMMIMNFDDETQRWKFYGVIEKFLKRNIEILLSF